MAGTIGRNAVLASLVALGAALALGAPPAKAGSETLTAAKKLIEQAKAGLVAAKDPKKPELELTIDDFVPVTDWPGPKTSAKAPEHKKIIAISCATVAPFCANVSLGSVEAAKALGWDATYLDGKGSVQGFVQAFETAINEKADAIVAMAIPESLVATYIAKAHAAGIKVVAQSSIPENISVENGHYDAYVSVREDSNALLQAWFVMADSDGKAKLTWMWDPGYPFLMAELDQQKKMFSADCPGCKHPRSTRPRSTPRSPFCAPPEDGALPRKIVRATRCAAFTAPKRGSFRSSSPVSARSPSISRSMTGSQPGAR